MPTPHLLSARHSNGGYLEGQLLVATTLITESCFNRSVLYIFSHNSEGAMGVIINHVVQDLKYSDVLRQLKIAVPPQFAELPVYLGGPVEPSRGLVIHSPDYTHADTVALADDLSVTSNLQILRDIVTGKGPSKHLLTLGYAGWSPGQLEAEIEANSWISVPATPSLVFGTDDTHKWEHSAMSLGVNMFKLSGAVGHA